MRENSQKEKENINKGERVQYSRVTKKWSSKKIRRINSPGISMRLSDSIPRYWRRKDREKMETIIQKTTERAIPIKRYRRKIK